MEIELPARLIFGACAFALAFAIAHLIRRGRIKEKYALLWVPVGATFSFFGIFPQTLVWISARAGLHYITVVLLCVIVAFTFILLYFTARLSQLREDVKNLAQEMALLKGPARPERDAPSPAAGWSAMPPAAAGSREAGTPRRP
jgi:hypothetical protein